MIIYSVFDEVLHEVPGDTLQGADLQSASLQRADLRDANLRGTGVRFWQLFNHVWILTPTHIHAGCLRYALEEPLPTEWPELSPEENQEANETLAFFMRKKGADE